MRVLIIKTSSLGDVIHALPVIDYLHQVCAGVEIEWVIEEPFLPIVEHNPRLSAVHVIRTKKWRKAPFSAATRNDLRALRQALQARPYDLVFDIQGNLKSGLVAWLSKGQTRCGFSSEMVQERLNTLFTNRQIRFRSTDRHATERYLRLVSAPFERDYPGMELTGTIFSAVEDEQAAERYLATLPEGPVILLQVGTTWQTKLWHREGWCQLARKILATYPQAQLLINWGSDEEKELGEYIIREAGPTVRLLPWLRIRELIPVIKRVDLVIGGDTGPVYLAAAVGTPTVSYYRATSAATYAPRGAEHRSVQAEMACAGCYRTTCDKDLQCRTSISADALFSAITDLLSHTGFRKDKHAAETQPGRP